MLFFLDFIGLDFWYTSNFWRKIFMGSGEEISTLFVTLVNPLPACLSAFRISAHSLSFRHQVSGSLSLLSFRLSACLSACIYAGFLPVLFFASCFLLLSCILHRIYTYIYCFSVSLSLSALSFCILYIFIYKIVKSFDFT